MRSHANSIRRPILKSSLTVEVLFTVVVVTMSAPMSARKARLVEGNPRPPRLSLIADGNPQPPPPPTSLITDGNPQPPTPPTSLIADGNPQPPTPPVGNRLTADGNPQPPRPPLQPRPCKP